MSFAWTDAAVDRLKSLCSTSVSAAEVAVTLAAEFDAPISRNAVLGKAHRLGLDVAQGAAAAMLERRQARERERQQARKAKPPKPAPFTSPLMAPVRATPDAPAIAHEPAPGVALFDLEPRHCRRPLWGDRDHPPITGMLFCGGTAAPGDSFCRACQPLMYTTAGQQRADARATRGAAR